MRVRTSSWFVLCFCAMWLAATGRSDAQDIRIITSGALAAPMAELSGPYRSAFAATVGV